jgi:hypothetical protein
LQCQDKEQEEAEGCHESMKECEEGQEEDEQCRAYIKERVDDEQEHATQCCGSIRAGCKGMLKIIHKKF